MWDDYAGFMFDAFDAGMRDVIEEEFECQIEDQEGEPDGAHLVGVRVRVLRTVAEMVFDSLEEYEAWSNGHVKDGLIVEGVE
jgi:hypothetical protein